MQARVSPPATFAVEEDAREIGSCYNAVGRMTAKADTQIWSLVLLAGRRQLNGEDEAGAVG